MLTILAFIVATQFGAERVADSPGVQSRIGAVEAAASSLADRTHDLRRALPNTPPAIIERADLVAPGRLRIYASPIRFEKDGTYLPIQLAWIPGETAVMECLTNTMETAIAKDGWKRVSGKSWSLSTRPRGAGDITVKRTDTEVLEVSGLWPDGAVTEYRLKRGGVKETIILERAPESTVWTYDTKLDGATRLELVEGDTQILVVADGATQAILPRPVAIDAKGDEYAGLYALDGDVLSTVFDGKWFDAAAYPVRVDPTASVDADICITAHSGDDYRRTWIKFELPEIADSVTAAVVGIYLVNNQIVDPATITVLSSTTDSAAWTTGSTAATMDGYTYTGTLDTVVFDHSSAGGWYEWDVLGSVGTEQAIADAYDDGDDPVDWTVRMYVTSGGTSIEDNSALDITLGDTNDSFLQFSDPSDANNPYLEITYDASATGTFRGSGSVGIIGL